MAFEVKGFGKMIMFGGYSNLSLRNHPKIKEAINNYLNNFGVGIGGVRFLANKINAIRYKSLQY